MPIISLSIRIVPVSNFYKNIIITFIFLWSCTLSVFATYQDLYNEAWTITKQNFYDSSMNHQDWNYWKKHYDGKINTQEDFDIAIAAMLASLGDVYTRYLPKSSFTEEHNDIHDNTDSLIKATRYFKTRIPKNVKYIRFDSMMNKNLPSDVKAVIEDAEKNPKVKGYIIDIRDDGGGLVKNASDISSLFMNDKVVVYVKTNSSMGVNKTKSADCITNKPIVILVNSYTASACEVLSGALQDNDRATIVGTTTYGKGVIQKIFKLSDGSGIHVTVMSYYTPKNKEINHNGIKPDVEVRFHIKDILFRQDVQLKKAIKLLSENK